MRRIYDGKEWGIHSFPLRFKGRDRMVQFLLPSICTTCCHRFRWSWSIRIFNSNVLFNFSQIELLYLDRYAILVLLEWKQHCVPRTRLFNKCINLIPIPSCVQIKKLLGVCESTTFHQCGILHLCVPIQMTINAGYRSHRKWCRFAGKLPAPPSPYLVIPWNFENNNGIYEENWFSGDCRTRHPEISISSCNIFFSELCGMLTLFYK